MRLMLQQWQCLVKPLRADRRLMQIGFRRDAADIEADAAQTGPFPHKRNLQSEICCVERRRISPGTPFNDHEFARYLGGKEGFWCGKMLCRQHCVWLFDNIDKLLHEQVCVNAIDNPVIV